jgi:tetratricopeptide (TPR) repeat protein
MNALVFALFAAVATTPTASQVQPGQVSYGACSPNISNVSGNVTIQFTGGCGGIDPNMVKQINGFLTDFPKTQRRLQELFDKKYAELNERLKEAENWAKKFRDLAKGLDEEAEDDALGKKASALLKDGDLDGATRILDQVIAREEKRDDRIARHYYNRALAYDLKFEPLNALPDYEKAYRHRPNEFLYADAYGEILRKQRRFLEAETVLHKALELAPDRRARAQTLNDRGGVYWNTKRYKEAEADLTEALQIQRQLAKQDPAALRREVATTLTNRGIIYRTTKRFSEAEADYTEALNLRRELAKENPAALQDVAQTLNNRGGVYWDTQRYKEAEADLTDALQLRRLLAKENPAAGNSGLAMTLTNRGILYRTTGRLKEAEADYTEALNLRRQLVRENPAAFRSDLAATLNSRAGVYRDTKRYKEAEADLTDALHLRRQLAKENPAAGNSDLAMTLFNRGTLYTDTRRFKEAEADYTEALRIYRLLAQENPLVYGDRWAQSALRLARTFQATGDPRACSASSENLPSSVSSDLRQSLNSLRLKLCPVGTADAGEAK